MSKVVRLASGEVDLSHPLRRKYSAEFKLRVVEEAARCSEPGEVMALLRREGIYHSHLRRWRQERAQRGVGALSGRKPGPVPKPPDPYAVRNRELEKELHTLKRKLKRAEWLLEIAKKGAELMEKMTLDHQFEADDSE